MVKTEVKTIAQLKKKCRTLAETENVQVVFSRNKDLITFQTKDNKFFEVHYGIENNCYHFYFEVEEENLSFNLFAYVFEYFAELTNLEGVESAHFNIHQTMKGWSNPGQENMLEAILETLGYVESEDSKYYVYKKEGPLFYVSEFITSVKKFLTYFKHQHPSFDFHASPSFNNPYAPNSFKHVFFAFTFNWQGFDGVIGFKRKNERFMIEEVSNELVGVTIDLPTLTFDKEVMDEAITDFLHRIPSQMALPNILNTPHYQLKKLLYRVVKSDDINTAEVMQKFEELGYQFIEIEDEAGKMLSDLQYFQSKEYRPIPRYPLQYKMSVHDGILQFHQHYIVLMGTTRYPNKAKYTIIDSTDKIELTVLTLSDELEKAQEQ